MKSDRDIFQEAEYRQEKRERQDRENADRVADWHPLSKLPYSVRLRHAQNFGENWASILSGLGDQ